MKSGKFVSLKIISIILAVIASAFLMASVLQGCKSPDIVSDDAGSAESQQDNKDSAAAETSTETADETSAETAQETLQQTGESAAA